MASIHSKLFQVLLRLINKKNSLRRQLSSGKFDLFSSPEPPRKLFRDCHIHTFQINNRNVFTISPPHSNGKHMLYLHGGAYVQNFVIFHWEFLAELVKKSNCTITTPDYPLAPSNTYVDTFEMLSALYRQIIATVDPADLVLMGDSAGGGLALALAQKMMIEQEPSCRHVILLSPWLDLSLSNPDIINTDPLDPFLDKESLQQAGKLYAGDMSPDHYLLSPINGPLEGLGKISLFIGSKEILVADARKLKHRAESLGININYYEYKDMVHAWMLLNFPESKKAKQQIIDFLQFRD